MSKNDHETPPWKPAMGIVSPIPIVIILGVAFVVTTVLLVLFALLKK